MYWPLIVLVALLTRAPALSDRFYSNDEATYSALAAKVLTGGLLYVDAVDHKPPGISTLYAEVYRAVGLYRLAWLRLLLVGLVAATGFVLGELAVALTGTPLARLAGLMYVVASATGFPDNVQAANTELVLNLPLSLAALAAFHTATARRPWTAFLLGATGGSLTAIATLFKYQAAVAGLAWLWPIASHRNRPIVKLSGAAGLAVGFAVVGALFIGRYAAAGHLDALWFWGWRYNFDYITSVPLLRQLSRFVTQTTVMAVIWMPLLLCAARRGARPGLAWAWLIAMAVAVSVGGRFFGNYYLMLLPALAILAASGVASDQEGGAARNRLLAGTAVLLAMASTLAACFWYALRPTVASNDQRYRAVGAWISTRAQPGDRLLVWGDSTQIYVYSGLVMGTRFAFCNYHTGKIWGTGADLADAPDAPSLAVPRAWDELLADLHRDPPAYIVDAAAGNLHGFDGHSADRYEPLWRILRAEYRLEQVVAGVPVYRRTAPKELALARLASAESPSGWRRSGERTRFGEGAASANPSLSPNAR